MSLLTSLAHIGLSRQDLQNLETENLLRLEKKLIAEQRLNGSITKNDVDQVMRLIKTYPHEIKTIAGYECLWGILNGSDSERIDPIKYHKKDELERLREFVSVQFKEELLKYITLNLNANNWNNLRVLWHYRCFLTRDVVDTLKGKAEDRMEYAITLLNEYLPDAQLCRKLPFLQSQDLYTLLGQLDERLFNAIIYQLLDFVKKNRQYVSENSFFSQMGTAIKTYETTNAALTREIRDADFTQIRRRNTEPEGNIPPPPEPVAETSAGGSCAVPAVGIVIFLVLFVIFIKWGSSKYKDDGYSLKYGQEDLIRLYYPGAGDIKDGSGEFFRREYFWVSNPALQMHAFAQARMYPVNYPVASWNATVLRMLKYLNPFSTRGMLSPYKNVKHGGPAINLFNKTDNECVVLAYYNCYYDPEQNQYVPHTREANEIVYAMYIPPHDSIKVDLKMMRLRFYMGKRLAKYKSLDNFNYPDSLDAKYSKFTRTDSMLFSKAFDLDNQYFSKNIVQDLVISQPDKYSYQINWTGNPMWLKRRLEFTSDGVADADRIAPGKPLLLDLRKMKYEPDDNKYAKTFMRHTDEVLFTPRTKLTY